MCSCLLHYWGPDLAHNPGMCPDWESNWRAFGSRARAQSTEPHQPEQNVFLFFKLNYITPLSSVHRSCPPFASSSGNITIIHLFIKQKPCGHLQCLTLSRFKSLSEFCCKSNCLRLVYRNELLLPSWSLCYHSFPCSIFSSEKKEASSKT